MYPDNLAAGLVTWMSQMTTTEPPVPSAAVRLATEDAGGQMWLYLLGGGSLVTILGMVGKGLTGWLSGRNAEVVRRDASLVVQRDTAWKERDEERRGRERAERNLALMMDHAGHLRYLLRKYGVPPAEIEIYPKLERNNDTTAPVEGAPTEA